METNQQIKTIQHEKINQQEMVIELLDILFEKDDIKSEELRRAKHILYSENIR